MEKIVGILAVPTVTISHVTDLMDDAIIVVQADSMVNFVMKVNLSGFFSFDEDNNVKLVTLYSMIFASKLMCRENYIQ